MSYLTNDVSYLYPVKSSNNADIPRLQSYVHLPNPANNCSSFLLLQTAVFQLFEKQKVHYSLFLLFLLLETSIFAVEDNKTIKMRTRIDIKRFVFNTVRIYFIFIFVYALVLCVLAFIPIGHSDDDPGFALAIGFMTGFYISLFNTLFVVFLYLTKINVNVLTKVKSGIVECILFIILHGITALIIDAIPTDFKYHYENITDDAGNIISTNAYGLRWWADDVHFMYYVFIVLTIIYIIVRFSKRRASKVS